MRRSLASLLLIALTGAMLAAAPAIAQAPPAPPATPDPAGTSPPLASPGPAAPGEPVGSLGADTREFSDTFDVQRWGTGEDARGSVAYQDGALRISVKEADNNLWSWSPRRQPHPVERVEGAVTLVDGAGRAGWMCGDARPDFLLGAVGTTGWMVAAVVDGQTQVLSRGPLPEGVDPSAGAPVTVAVECAVTGDGGDRILLSVEGSLVADVTGPEIGPFDRAAVFAAADAPDFIASFDDVDVLVGDSYAPSATRSSPAPTSSPTPIPSFEPATSLGADTLAFEDDFSDDSLWVTRRRESGTIAYADEALTISITEPENSLWTWRTLDTEVSVLRVEGTVSINDADGGAGWTCGTPARAHVIGIVTPTEWVMGTIVANQVEVVDRGPLPGDARLDGGGTAQIGLECAVVSDDTVRALMWVGDALVADIALGLEGPFSRAGAYADVVSPPMRASFDDVTVWVGNEYAPQSDQ